MNSISHIDKEIYNAIQKELNRQQNTLELIASENIVSDAVLEAAGSVLTNKYAEGYPSKRYYGGCEHVDEVEELACKRAMDLFGADYANVQPHSGSSANMAAYRALVKHSQTVMGMDLAHGGHLTHGSLVSFSGQDYKIVSYGVDKNTETIDYEQVAKIACKNRPTVIFAGASSYPRQLNFERFRQIADEVGAILVVDMAHIAGLVAAGVHPSPIKHAHITTTTTHKTLRGPRGGLILIGNDVENHLDIRASKSGRLFRYGELIDKAVFPGIQGGPLMHIIAAKAVAFKEAQSQDFKVYQKKIIENAQTLARVLSEQNIRLISGGTDNHLILMDVSSFGITGKQAEDWLGQAGITVNKNALPFDPKPPNITSGIRIGTPAVTTRKMGLVEMEQIADFIVEALKTGGNSAQLILIAQKVRRLCSHFPV